MDETSITMIFVGIGLLVISFFSYFFVKTSKLINIIFDLLGIGIVIFVVGLILFIVGKLL